MTTSSETRDPWTVAQHSNAQQDGALPDASAEEEEAAAKLTKIPIQSGAADSVDVSDAQTDVDPADKSKIGSTDKKEALPSPAQSSKALPPGEYLATDEPALKQPSGQGVVSSLDALINDMDQFYSDYVRNGKILYQDLSLNQASLNELVHRIGDEQWDGLEAEQREALIINSYNILVIHQVINHYPISSPMDIAGFFDVQQMRIGSKEASLNDWEDELRDDARIHFALVCAALGCPPIQSLAYRPKTLGIQLDMATRKALNDPKFIRYRQGDQVAEISRIFEWYVEDFGGADAIRDYINRFRTVPIPEEIDLSYYEYNWKLNIAL